jgi:hypothetical protein
LLQSCILERKGTNNKILSEPYLRFCDRLIWTVGSREKECYGVFWTKYQHQVLSIKLKRAGFSIYLLVFIYLLVLWIIIIIFILFFLFFLLLIILNLVYDVFMEI